MLCIVELHTSSRVVGLIIRVLWLLTLSWSVGGGLGCGLRYGVGYGLGYTLDYG